MQSNPKFKDPRIFFINKMIIKGAWHFVIIFFLPFPLYSQYIPSKVESRFPQKLPTANSNKPFDLSHFNFPEELNDAGIALTDIKENFDLLKKGTDNISADSLKIRIRDYCQKSESSLDQLLQSEILENGDFKEKLEIHSSFLSESLKNLDKLKDKKELELLISEIQIDQNSLFHVNNTDFNSFGKLSQVADDRVGINGKGLIESNEEVLNKIDLIRERNDWAKNKLQFPNNDYQGVVLAKNESLLPTGWQIRNNESLKIQSDSLLDQNLKNPSVNLGMFYDPLISFRSGPLLGMYLRINLINRFGFGAGYLSRFHLTPSDKEEPYGWGGFVSADYSMGNYMAMVRLEGVNVYQVDKDEKLSNFHAYPVILIGRYVPIFRSINSLFMGYLDPFFEREKRLHQSTFGLRINLEMKLNK
jgi:hypothetical protein